LELEDIPEYVVGVGVVNELSNKQLKYSRAITIKVILDGKTYGTERVYESGVLFSFLKSLNEGDKIHIEGFLTDTYTIDPIKLASAE